jgi:uncharacterized protein YlxW (UPF0749 family)
MNRTPPEGRAPDASMTLITTMMRRPLDPGYAAAAQRRREAGLHPSTSLHSPLLLAATVVIGLVVGIAAYNLTAASSPRSEVRNDLVTQIEDRREEVDALSAQAAELQGEVTALESDQLASQGDAQRSRDLAVAVGALPMEGPGLRVTLDDAPGSGEEDPAAAGDQAAQGRVYSRDLQFVVNSLWEAGAEAISINDIRLTSVSTIRFAGSAIIVDFRPLTRPYVITALGDPGELPAAFADGPGASYLSTLASTFGVQTDTEVVDNATVPAGVRLSTQYATTGDTGATPTPTTTGTRTSEDSS